MNPNLTEPQLKIYKFIIITNVLSINMGSGCKHITRLLQTRLLKIGGNIKQDNQSPKKTAIY